VLISAGVALSILGYLAAGMIASPRVLFALAEQQDFPRCLGAVHSRYRTPYASIISFAAAVWILALLDNFTWNARLTGVSRLVTYGLSCAALPVLRRKNIRQPRFRLPAGDLLAAIVVLCGILLTQIDKGEVLVVLATLTIGSVNWLIVNHRSARYAEAGCIARSSNHSRCQTVPL